MTAARERRLLKELNDIKKDDDSGISVSVPDESNLSKMVGYIIGPPDTPYQGGKFSLDITIPANYPFSPPEMYFKTKIWHPNVSSQTGVICLDTLKSAWSPVQTIKTALLSLRSLLESPEPRDPQDAQVASEMLGNPERWACKAHQWSITYAGAPDRMTELDFSKYGNEKGTNTVHPSAYGGYEASVIETFTNLGLQVEDVVRALRALKIPTNQGRAFPLTPDIVDAVCNKVWGD